MDWFRGTASVLLVGIGIAHSFLGEKYILVPLLRRKDLPRLFGGEEFTHRTLRFAWHLTTLAWWGFAALLLVPAGSGDGPRSLVIAATFLVSGGGDADSLQGAASRLDRVPVDRGLRPFRWMLNRIAPRWREGTLGQQFTRSIQEGVMRRLILSAAAGVLVLLTGCARQADYSGYSKFGAPLEAPKPVPIAKAVSSLQADAPQDTVVAGTIKEVCQSMGCWMTLDANGKPVRVKFTASESCADGFFIPKNAAGHEAIVQGQLALKEIPEETAKHYAIEAGKPDAEIHAIVGPQKEYSMLATAVLISDPDTLEKPE